MLGGNMKNTKIIFLTILAFFSCIQSVCPMSSTTSSTSKTFNVRWKNKDYKLTETQFEVYSELNKEREEYIKIIKGLENLNNGLKNGITMLKEKIDVEASKDVNTAKSLISKIKANEQSMKSNIDVMKRYASLFRKGEAHINTIIQPGYNETKLQKLLEVFEERKITKLEAEQEKINKAIARSSEEDEQLEKELKEIKTKGTEEKSEKNGNGKKEDVLEGFELLGDEKK
jgi:hypothetical protein